MNKQSLLKLLTRLNPFKQTTDCLSCTSTSSDFAYALWIALILNGLMFLIEIGVSFFSGSIAVFADAMDFLGDAGNYGASLIALKFSPRWRSWLALAKGIVMGTYGVLVLTLACFGLFVFESPNGLLMIMVAILALSVNMAVAIFLYRHRHGDSNRRSIWLCTRNDVLVNIAVLIAGAVILLIHQRWPDVVVAVIIGVLGLKASISVIRHAYQELVVK